jgi:hypothetical protein
MTSLLDALRDPMHALDPSSERDALTEILRVRDEELAVARQALESARKALSAKQSEVDDLTAQDRLWRRLPAAVATRWGACGFMPPFTPGTVSNNNDGVVRDSSGMEIANCGGCEARADVIAALLNEAAQRMK